VTGLLLIFALPPFGSSGALTTLGTFCVRSETRLEHQALEVCSDRVS
jgi:hypothetical protein